MHAYLRFLAPNRNDLGVAGGLTSLASTRRYFYNYAPEGVNLELQKDALTADSYGFAGGQCVWGGVVFNGVGSDGVVDSVGFTPLVTSRLDRVLVEDQQGPSVANPVSAAGWVTGDAAPVEWDDADNGYRRGSTGARIAGAGQVDVADPGNGHHGVWVPVGALPDGAHEICAYRTGSGWGEASGCATFRLDRTNPQPPIVVLSPDLGGAWGNTTVTVETGPTGDGSGSGWNRNQFSVDGGAWTDGPLSLTLTTEGNHTVAARAVDTAGRVSTPSALRVVRIDATAPAITAAVVSGSSGVLSWGMSDGVGFGSCAVVVEVSGPGTGGALTRVFSQAAGTLPAQASVQLPLGSMPNGDYQATLTICDAAGNTTRSVVAFTWTGNPDGVLTGAAARFAATGLTARGSTVQRDVGGVAVPVVRRVYGRPFTLVGRLQRPDGSALAGAAVELRDSAGRYEAGARSDGNGGFALTAAASVGGGWTLNPVGSQQRQGVVWLEVKPIVRVRLRMAAGHRRLVASGSLAPSVGAGGKAVQLEWFDRTTKRWRPALDGRVRDDGRFTLTYRFSRTGRYRVPVRVSVKADAGWPYLPASSRPVTVAVG